MKMATPSIVRNLALAAALLFSGVALNAVFDSSSAADPYSPPEQQPETYGHSHNSVPAWSYMPGCGVSWLNTTHNVKALLDLPQRIWIGATLNALVNSALTTNVLIWGCGADSPTWFAAHCGATAGSELLYVEGDEAWVAKTTTASPYLAPHIIHFNNYESSLATQKAFFANPDNSYLDANLPERVRKTCWDLILVDAPIGYGKNSPGRHAVTAWVDMHVRRCIKDGHPRDITVFLHDIERPIERRAYDTFLVQNAEEIGKLNAPTGLLGGVVYRAKKT